MLDYLSAMAETCARGARPRALIFATVSVMCIAAGLLYFHQPLKIITPAPTFPLSSIDHANSSAYAPVFNADNYQGSGFYFIGTPTVQLPVASYNQPPAARLRTPLFMGITQNYQMLRQGLYTYIANGWPPEDIMVVDNTGVFDANALHQLSADNQFHLDYDEIRSLGVSILQTPVLLTFAQLQNFYLRTAMAQGWPSYFWSHMDVLILGDEEIAPYKSFYEKVLEVVEETRQRPDDWALRWFAYDQLTMMNVNGWRKIGQWDPFIPYYHSDCDAYSRAGLHGLLGDGTNVHAGKIFNIADLMPEFETKLFPAPDEQGPNSTRFQKLRVEMKEMQHVKGKGFRPWQDKQLGGAGEPFTYHPKAFRHAWLEMSVKGQKVYEQKWGSLECHWDTSGGRLSQMWAHVKD